MDKDNYLRCFACIDLQMWKETKAQLLTAAYAQSQLPDDKQISALLSVSKENLFLSLCSGDLTKPEELGQVCVYAHLVWQSDGFFEGMDEYQSFSNICFKFWNNCERDLRAELSTCISVWHNSAYSLLQSLILLFQSCLYTYLKHSVTLVKWNIKNYIYSSSLSEILICKWNFSDVLWKPSLW